MISQKYLRNFLHILSLLVGISSTYLTFVLFLQTASVSRLRLLAAFILFTISGLATFFIHIRWLLPNIQTSRIGAKAVLGFSFLLPLTFLPAFLVQPEFPTSPLLRPPTNIALQIALSPQAPTAIISEADVKVLMDKEVLGLRDFELNGAGARPAATLSLESGGSAWLQMEVPATKTVILNITPPPTEGTLTVFWDRNISVIRLPIENIVLKRKFGTPLVITIFYFLAQYTLYAYIFLLILTWLETKPRWQFRTQEDLSRWIITLFALLFAAITVYYQTLLMFGDSVFTIKVDQYERHLAVLQGTSPDPWQYRILSEWIAEVLIRFFDIGFAKETAIVCGFMATRILQNIAIFLLAYTLFKKLSNSNWLALLGLFILCISMLNSNHDSDLALNTYSDILFYILAVLFILDKRYNAIIPIAIFASLNRETSGLIPFLLLAVTFDDKRLTPSKKYIPFIISFLGWVLTFWALRFAFPNRPQFIAYGHTIGASMWTYNIASPITWEQLFRTFNLLPFISLFLFFEWPPFLRRLFVIMVPIWIGIHFITSTVAETRLFLVPQAVIFIPAILFLFKSQLSGGEKIVTQG